MSSKHFTEEKLLELLQGLSFYTIIDSRQDLDSIAYDGYDIKIVYTNPAKVVFDAKDI